MQRVGGKLFLLHSYKRSLLPSTFSQKKANDATSVRVRVRVGSTHTTHTNDSVRAAFVVSSPFHSFFGSPTTTKTESNKKPFCYAAPWLVLLLPYGHQSGGGAYVIHKNKNAARRATTKRKGENNNNKYNVE